MRGAPGFLFGRALAASNNGQSIIDRPSYTGAPVAHDDPPMPVLLPLAALVRADFDFDRHKHSLGCQTDQVASPPPPCGPTP
jgi:hypothetical protein